MAALKSERKRLGDNLQTLRKERGLTQEQVAEKTGLHVSFVGRIERGQISASLTTLVAFKRAFRCKWVELLNDG